MTFRDNAVARSKLDFLVNGTPDMPDPCAVRVVVEYVDGSRVLLDAFGKSVLDNAKADRIAGPREDV